MLDPEGKPVAGAQVTGWRASFASCPPAQIRFKVFEENSLPCEQEALITPGLNPEITIRLPAAKAR